VSVVDVVRTDGVCRVTLNRPERLNALGSQIREELEGVVRELEDDTATRVVVVRGAGRAFSAGADLTDRASAPPIDDWHVRRRAGGAWQRLLARLESLPQVTVASLHGWAIGGALLLATACDIRIAADDLRVSIPELAIGLPLTWAGLPRLVREIGLPRTRDLVMTARVITAAEALQWGIVTRVVAAADLDAATDALVDELLAMPAAPLAMTRDALAAMGATALATAWADPDLIAWATREPEAAKAAADYVRERITRRPD
jgi:enoyl-CoA hydratase/carnithine racemase